MAINFTFDCLSYCTDCHSSVRLPTWVPLQAALPGIIAPGASIYTVFRPWCILGSLLSSWVSHNNWINLAILFFQKRPTFLNRNFGWYSYDNLATWLATIDRCIAIIGPLFLWALGYQRAFKALSAWNEKGEECHVLSFQLFFKR